MIFFQDFRLFWFIVLQALSSDWLKIDEGSMSLQVKFCHYIRRPQIKEMLWNKCSILLSISGQRVIYNASECANSPVTSIGQDTLTCTWFHLLVSKLFLRGHRESHWNIEMKVNICCLQVTFTLLISIFHFWLCV